MTDSKTEWRAEFARKYWRVVGVRDGVVAQIIAEFLDKPTALKIAAVNEMEAALERCLKREKKHAQARGLSDCACIMLNRQAENEYEAGKCPHQEARAALAKARGESDG